MNKRLLFLLFFVTMGRAYADCGFELSTPVLTYGVSESNPPTPSLVTINRKKDNGNPCSRFFLAFGKGQAGNYNRRATNASNGESINYNIYKNSNSTGVLKDAGEITSTNEVLFGSINKDEGLDLTYYFMLASINANLPPRSGTYVDIVKIQAYSGFYYDINGYEATRDQYITIIVPKFISLSLVDVGESFDVSRTSKTLDFGELEENEALNFDLRVSSNAGYIVKISSVNNGLLKRIDGTGSRSEISYDFYANNIKKSLSSSASNPETIASATGRTASGGAQIPIKVLIKSVTDKDPGIYQDYLTLSVISNE